MVAEQFVPYDQLVAKVKLLEERVEKLEATKRPSLPRAIPDDGCIYYPDARSYEIVEDPDDEADPMERITSAE